MVEKTNFWEKLWDVIKSPTTWGALSVLVGIIVKSFLGIEITPDLENIVKFAFGTLIPAVGGFVVLWRNLIAKFKK
jgi:hypothetical protein